MGRLISNIVSHERPVIQLTAAAQREILRLSQRSRLDSPHIHLGVVPGGCLERMYTLEVRAIAPEDQIVVYAAANDGTEGSASAGLSKLQVSVSVDASDSLEELTLDYSEDLMGGNFRFVNPKASQTCSCGQSFSLVQGDASQSVSAS